MVSLSKSPYNGPRAIDEVTPLLNPQNSLDDRYCNFRDEEAETVSQSELQKDAENPKSLMGIISVLLIGVFISQADGSLVLAAYGKISSEFNDLEDGSWLFSVYVLAMCVTQPLYGKLSNIYGRKRCLQVSYLLFAMGTMCCGFGQTMAQVIAARAVQGAGGAGMVCMVSILLTDLVPLQDVALYRSYVNIAQTVGRSCGGAVGGYLTETIGWRWVFMCQLPPTIIAIILVEWKLPSPQDEHTSTEDGRTKLKRIDWAGAVAMSLAILSTLLVIDMGGQKYDFSHPFIIISIIIAVVSTITFLVTEKFYAKEPIFPLHLLTHYVVVTSYITLFLQTFAQTALMLIIPIYFQVTKNASTAVAGAYLIPSVFGNTIGGLTTGAFINRTGRYKIPLIIGSIASGISFTCLLIFWWRDINFAEAMLIFPAGLATGVIHSAIFIGLTSGVAEDEIAIAGSGLYLSGSVGGVIGSTGSSAVFQFALERGLERAVAEMKDGREIIRKTLSDLNFIQQAAPALKERLIPAYLSAIHYVFGMGLMCAALCFCIGLISRERQLKRQ